MGRHTLGQGQTVYGRNHFLTRYLNNVGFLLLRSAMWNETAHICSECVK